MTDETMRGIMETKNERPDVAPVSVCSDCYMAFHYGPDDPGVEYGATWDRERFVGSVDLLSRVWGYRLVDGTCSSHVPGPAEYDDDGNDITDPCPGCRETDADNGITTFSKAWCDLCGDHRAGGRFRLWIETREMPDDI